MKYFALKCEIKNVVIKYDLKELYLWKIVKNTFSQILCSYDFMNDFKSCKKNIDIVFKVMRV